MPVSLVFGGSSHHTHQACIVEREGATPDDIVAYIGALNDYLKKMKPFEDGFYGEDVLAIEDDLAEVRSVLSEHYDPDLLKSKSWCMLRWWQADKQSQGSASHSAKPCRRFHSHHSANRSSHSSTNLLRRWWKRHSLSLFPRSSSMTGRMVWRSSRSPPSRMRKSAWG